MHERVPVCLPRIGAIPLLVLRVGRSRPRAVYFDIWPRYAKALLRWLRVPPGLLLGAYAALAGCPVRRAAPEAGARGAPSLNLEAMKAVSRIVLALSEEIGRQGWTEVLGAAIGELEAEAYFHRRFPREDIWPQTLALSLCLDALQGERPLLVWSALWPVAWERAVAQELKERFGVELLPWPRAYRRLAQIGCTSGYVARTLAMLAGRLAIRRWRRPRREPIALAIEFIDPRRLGAGPHDTNFVQDGRRVTREDLLYFLTPEQARHYRRHRENVRAALQSAAEAGARVVDLRSLPLSRSSATVAGRLGWRLVRGSLELGAACLGASFKRGCEDVITYLPLFDAFTPSTVMHTQTPNGDTGSRLDSAVLTGLARRFGSRCVGYQNRATYDTVYEDAFDCYDVYLAWGPGWREFLPDRNRYIDRVVAVGCLDNDGSPARPPTRRAQPVVSIFTSELGGSLYASHDVAELVGVCAELARRHPECSFRVKTKDPEDVDHLLADPALRERCCSRHGNFEFLRLARHDVSRVIGDSDIVIASAWTTPGADALLLEKRTIFYNPMRGGGEPFRGLPHLIASSPEELLEVFELARRDYDRYAAVNREQIVRLDPFRDGRPRDRIADELLAPGSGPPGGR